MYSQAVVLDAGMTVGEARGRLSRIADAEYVVLRRAVGRKLHFHPFTAGELRAGIAGAATGSTPLWEHLGLREGNAAQTVQAEAAATGAWVLRRAVVLEDDQAVGVMEPRTRDHGYRPPRFRGAVRGTGDGSADDDGRRTLEAYPRLRAPREVGPGERFDLEVGLSRTPVRGVGGRPMRTRVGIDAREVELGVEVITDGFHLPEGGRRTLRVPVANVEAGAVVVPLVAPTDVEGIRLSQLVVHFTCEGAPCGYASWKIAVGAASAGPGAGAGDGRGGRSEDGGTSAPVRLDGGRPADLTVRIDKPDRDQTSGRFVWSFDTPHTDDLPAPAAVNLGADAGSFARTVIEDVTDNDGRETLDLALRGIGARIAEKIPDAFFELLALACEAAAAEGRVPTVLILSAEPHVPWELAFLEEPFDPGRPPFLGAQVLVARWITGVRGVPLPPPRARSVHRMAVVAGDYASKSGYRPLPQALREAEALARDYDAVELSATHADIADLLEGALVEDGGSVRTEAIHFACHGEIDPENPQYAGIILSKGSVLSPSLFRCAPVGKIFRPFLFLNACKVGQGGEQLGEYAGFAGASISAGFSGFLAPLWSVDDGVAHDFALEFYRRAFEPTPVSAILRDLRARYSADEADSTWLAYVFYGHPDLLITRDESAE